MRTLENKLNNIRLAMYPKIYKFFFSLLTTNCVVLHEARNQKNIEKSTNVKASYFAGGTFCVDFKLHEMDVLMMFNLNGDCVSIEGTYHDDHISVKLPLRIESLKILNNIYLENGKEEYLKSLIDEKKTILHILN